MPVVYLAIEKYLQKKSGKEMRKIYTALSKVYPSVMMDGTVLYCV